MYCDRGATSFTADGGRNPLPYFPLSLMDRAEVMPTQHNLQLSCTSDGCSTRVADKSATDACTFAEPSAAVLTPCRCLPQPVKRPGCKVRARTHTRTHARTHARTHTHTHARMYALTYTHIHTHACTHKHTHTHTHTHVHTHTDTRARARVHTHTHVHSHTHTHTHTRVRT